MKFIKLISVTGNILFLVADKIESFRLDTLSDPKLPPQTIVDMDTGGCFFVKESPTEILEKIENAEISCLPIDEQLSIKKCKDILGKPFSGDGKFLYINDKYSGKIINEKDGAGYKSIIAWAHPTTKINKGDAVGRDSAPFRPFCVKSCDDLLPDEKIIGYAIDEAVGDKELIRVEFFKKEYFNMYKCEMEK